MRISSSFAPSTNGAEMVVWVATEMGSCFWDWLMMENLYSRPYSLSTKKNSAVNGRGIY